MPNPITMLKADHVKVKGLLRQLEASGSRSIKERERLVRDIEREPLASSCRSSPFTLT